MKASLPVRWIVRCAVVIVAEGALIASAALLLPGVEPGRALRLAAGVALASLATLAVLAARASVRLRPLFSEQAAVSPSLLQEAFASPLVAAAAQAAASSTLIALDAVGVLPVSGASSVSRIPLAFLALAVGAAAILPTSAAWRSVLRPVLTRASLDTTGAPIRERLTERIGARTALPTAAIALAATAAVLAAAPGLPPGSVALLVLLPVAATAAAALLGARIGAALAADLASLVPAIDRAGADTPLAEALSSVGPMRIHGPGRVADSLLLLSRRFDEVRAREDRARSAVLDAQQLKTQFMAAMSHDLRSPLNGILGFSELLVRAGERGQLNPAQRESVTLIQRAGGDLLRLIDDVLDSAKLDAGKLTIRRQWTPSVEILTEAVRRGEELVKNTDLRIVAELQPGLPPVYVDAERIVQAVVGLLGHAAHAMDRGTIRLRARVAAGPPGPAEQVRVDVIDQGAGIRAADRERIFEAFREIAEPSGRRIGGLGLGLALSRSLARAHGGDVWFETRAGEGTTFTVALPLGEG